MKYADTFFKFPIRIYDGFALEKAEEEEEKLGEAVPSEFIVGAKRIRFEDILGWNDAWDKEDSLDQVRETGFPVTVLETKDGTFLCNWDRKKFEEELNKAWDKVEEAKKI